MSKRTVEVFSAGCPACEDTIQLVNDIACPSCEVSILDMKDPAVIKRAKDLGITRVPAVVVSGKLAECCVGAGRRRLAFVPRVWGARHDPTACGGPAPWGHGRLQRFFPGRGFGLRGAGATRAGWESAGRP